MSTPMSLIAQGSFTNAAGAVAATNIELPKRPDYFVIKNRSLWGTAPTDVIQAEWYYGYGAGQAICITEGGASALTATAIAAGGAGFTFVDYSSQTPGALVNTPGTAITAANPAVVSEGVPPAVGDIVRVFNTTAMLQIAGMDFTVTAIAAGVSYTLGYMDASGVNFVAATNATYRVIPAKNIIHLTRFITGITAANPCVVTVSVAHNYLVGDYVAIHNPDANMGMPEINGITARITAVTASTFTLDLDSSAFTAFLWPTSAVAAAGLTHPTVTAVGEVATKLTSSLNNGAYYAMHIDTGVLGTTSDVIDWMAFSRDYTV